MPAKWTVSYRKIKNATRCFKILDINLGIIQLKQNFLYLFIIKLYLLVNRKYYTNKTIPYHTKNNFINL